MSTTNRRDLTRFFGMAFVPLVFLTLAVIAIAIYSQKVQTAESEIYQVPNTQDSFELVDFMRALHQEMPSLPGELSNTLEAAQRVNELIAANPAADPADVREAKFYQLFYRWQNLFAGLVPTHQEQTRQLDADLLIQETLAYLETSELEGEESRLFSTCCLWLSQTGDPTIGLPACEQLEQIVARFDGNANQTRYQDLLTGIKNQLGLIGNPFELQSRLLDGSDFEMQTLKGKVVYVEFWTTGCGPCRADFPSLKRIYKNYQDRGFEIVGISLDRSSGLLKKFVADENLPWLQLWNDRREGNEALKSRFAINAVPSTMLLDREGRVVALGVRPLAGTTGKDLETRLDGLLLAR